ncbi:MAG TPA: hypothetical protein VL625_09890 [Patescibacteria group bacterium]|nr:hypothetical protein [Patescibacteria group bacterium]
MLKRPVNDFRKKASNKAMTQMKALSQSSGFVNSARCEARPSAMKTGIIITSRNDLNRTSSRNMERIDIRTISKTMIMSQKQRSRFGEENVYRSDAETRVISDKTTYAPDILKPTVLMKHRKKLNNTQPTTISVGMCLVHAPEISRPTTCSSKT